MSQNIVPAQYQPTRQRFDGYATESAKITRLAGRFRAVRNANAGYGVAAAGELAEFESPCRTARMSRILNGLSLLPKPDVWIGVRVRLTVRGC